VSEDNPLLSVTEALGIMLAAAADHPRGIEQVAVEAADGRVLASDLQALRSQPPANVSAMDGYALRAADTNPPGTSLSLVGESAAGHPFSGILRVGETIRIFTGAIVPEGADAVLIQERSQQDGARIRSEILLNPGIHIRTEGRDFRTGETPLKTGTRLTPGTIALAGAMNHAAIPVFRRPRIAILATGDELVAPGSAHHAPGVIVATNSYAIAAIARREGAEILDLGIAKDTRESLDAKFDAAENWQADCLVTIGGASVGQHDLVRPVAEARGARFAFTKVAMRPGKPSNFGIFGRRKPIFIVGLPGNPISSFVCAEVFLRPFLAALQGDSHAAADRGEPAFLGDALPANDERQNHLRSRLTRDEAGRLIATPFPDQDSSLLSVYAEAGALVIRPAHAPAASAGDPCIILRL
jgi:molybdopterin molybdotransferase